METLVAGLLDISAQTEDARALALLRTEGGVPVGSIAHDRWDGRERFRVVDDGGPTVETDGRRKRRLKRG